MMPQNSASDGRSIVVRRLKEKFGRNSGSLPYDSARLGLPTLYANVLQREGEPFGVASWVEAMNRGMTKSQVVLGFSESAENTMRPTPMIQQGLWIVDDHAAIVARLYDAA